MTALLLAPFTVAVPTALVLRVFVTEERLHTKYYANLLATDLLAIMGKNESFVALLIYISGIQILCLFETVWSTYIN